MPLLTWHSIVFTQFLGVPLYLINKNWYYAYMATTKESFGIFVTTLTNWWAPTVVRISGDASVAGQLRKTADGRVECDFPDRLVMMANHQVCLSSSRSNAPTKIYSSTQTGSTSGGYPIRTRPKCTAIST